MCMCHKACKRDQISVGANLVVISMRMQRPPPRLCFLHGMAAGADDAHLFPISCGAGDAPFRFVPQVQWTGHLRDAKASWGHSKIASAADPNILPHRVARACSPYFPIPCGDRWTCASGTFSRPCGIRRFDESCLRSRNGSGIGIESVRNRCIPL